MEPEPSILVKPNPFSGGLLTVELKGLNGAPGLTIYDTVGKILKEVHLKGTNTATFEFNPRPGIYFIKVTLSGRETIEKLIVN
jgi:hypothetical protein